MTAVLIIRPSQMKAFEREAELDFVRRVRTKLLDLQAPGCPTPPDESTIQSTVVRAREFHLTREKDIARLLQILWLRFGDISTLNLPRPALSILCTWGADPERKLDRFEAWAGAAGRRQHAS